MTIRSANDRLWSGLSTDRKPDNWAPGIMLLETDTGVWWVTGEDRQWRPCHPTFAAHETTRLRVEKAERDQADQGKLMAGLRAEVDKVKGDVEAIKARPKPRQIA